MISRDEIIQTLISKPTVRTRVACKAVSELNDASFCQYLESIDLESLIEKNWETAIAVIKAIGVLKCQASAPCLKRITFRIFPEFETAKSHAAMAWVRIARKDIYDADPVLKVLKSGTFSAINGALNAMGYDRMMPNPDVCDQIITLVWDYGRDRPRGTVDPRYGLAAACAGWNCSKRTAFLEHCLESQDVPLTYVAKHSLNGKYIKLR